jgi:hypothetical protein
MKRLLLLSLLMLSYTATGAIFSVHKGLTTSKGWMTTTAKVAECVLENKEFLKEVGAFKKYDFTDKTPAQVEAILTKVGTLHPVELTTYAPKWRPSKAIAYRNPGSTTIYFNIYRNPRDQKEMVNTIVHEYLHILGFDHGGNSSKGKQNSVNYAVGAMSEKYVEGCK